MEATRTFTFSFILFACCLCVLVNISVVAGEWGSLVFILPDPEGNQLSRNCATKSRNFCLYGYVSDPRPNQPPLQWNDKYDHVFEILVNNDYKSLNWFSLEDNGLGGCCYFQMNMFQTEGIEKGISPPEYYGKIHNFTSAGKHLNYISVRSTNANGCHRSNTISALGFGDWSGPGVIREVIEDRRVNVNNFYHLPGKMYFLKRHLLQAHLNFNLFKRTVICKDHPWICATYR
ncbi:uncharacterized protein LOC142338677 [Convolutriloba macropyga]|uniref:uncharacterized protein LOC142338677 n=1 Tax=Convolutriloba macropyga TaxID=536237 RepID=UPI003F51EA19